MSEGQTQRQGLPALRPVELLVLSELARRQQHGYGIVRAVESATEGRVSLVPGNLYRVLNRLIERGFIAECEDPSVDGDVDGRRRYYQITERGRIEAGREVERVEVLAEHARRRMGESRST